MNELLEKNQVLSLVPQNFKNSNKGKVIEIHDEKFLLEMFHDPDGILPKKIQEFYSPTKHGMLFFSSSVSNIEGNVLTVNIPRKHRFLQRRAFTRIKFTKGIECKSGGKLYNVLPIDLSAGGMKLHTTEPFNIDTSYDVELMLLNKNIKCEFKLIRIEKNDDNSYTLSGRFNNLSNADKMALMQFCMRKSIENANR